jgi:hypothetical protein
MLHFFKSFPLNLNSQYDGVIKYLCVKVKVLLDVMGSKLF